MDSTISGSYMKSELAQKGNDLATNIHTCLSLAVDAARNGGDYDAHWERAMQHQTELLRVINQLKFAKPERGQNEA